MMILTTIPVESIPVNAYIFVQLVQLLTVEH